MHINFALIFNKLDEKMWLSTYFCYPFFCLSGCLLSQGQYPISPIREEWNGTPIGNLERGPWAVGQFKFWQLMPMRLDSPPHPHPLMHHKAKSNTFKTRYREKNKNEEIKESKVGRYCCPFFLGVRSVMTTIGGLLFLYARVGTFLVPHTHFAN